MAPSGNNGPLALTASAGPAEVDEAKKGDSFGLMIS